jgi:hypothetical protein
MAAIFFTHTQCLIKCISELSLQIKKFVWVLYLAVIEKEVKTLIGVIFSG